MAAPVNIDPDLGGRIIAAVSFRYAYTQEQIARMLGVSTGHLSNIRAGRVPMDVGMAVGLAAKIGDPAVVFDLMLQRFGCRVTDATQEPASPVAATLSRLLESDGGAVSVSPADIQELSPYMFALRGLLDRLEVAAGSFSDEGNGRRS